MIHARPDYNRMQDPALADPSLLSPGSAPIAEDEPVCLFRAQDKHFIAVLEHYSRLVDVLDADDVMYPDTEETDRIIAIQESVEKHVRLAREWQAKHPPKEPDL